MKTRLIKPNLKHFIKSLRDVGYVFEIAVADILDNCISAKAKNIRIYTVPEPEIVFNMLDDGEGMTDDELCEAMRLATKDPEAKRDKHDLGRFGLGLKTASFSQCRKLTVISKKSGKISAFQWDLDYISEKDDWHLISPSTEELQKHQYYNNLELQESGTLVVWELIDRFKKENYSLEIDKLNKHLSLVFHRFLEGIENFKSIKIFINKMPLKPFNPFNPNNPATQQSAPEKIVLFGSNIFIQTFVLPHHSKVSQQEFERYATEEGYTKSQGFYLYRANRLLIYGTWWGLNKSIDAYKLVRVKIDISNEQDKYWGIDIKKSTAKPISEIKSDLIRIINRTIEKGLKTYTGRGKKIEDKTINRFWTIVPCNNEFRFSINKDHPICQKLMETIDDKDLLNFYFKGLEAFLPIEAIQAHIHQNPHAINQENALSEKDILELTKKIKELNVSDEYKTSLLKTEIFKNKENLLK